MSEDVDIKLVPQPNFLADTHYSRTQRKKYQKGYSPDDIRGHYNIWSFWV
ncbi:hypothetical protein B738_14437 [Photorhabdus temperata subsp. temperata M1021]|nr:hypothetical protein B738_14437 [Photorhabdus temperata subsp. temperata M1021]